MKRIDEYVEKIYKDFDKKSEDLNILKEETRNHLIDEVEDLKNQGLTEEVSINIAISKFGSIAEVKKELSEVIKTEAKFAKIILISAFVLLSIWLFSFLQESFMTEKDQFASNGKASEVQLEIHKILENKSLISKEVKSDIVMAINRYNKANGIMFNGVTVSDSNQNIVFQQQVNNISVEEQGSHPSFEVRKPFGKVKWFVSLDSTKEYNSSFISWIKTYQMEHFSYRFLLINMQGIVIAVYWVLFLIWFIIKSHHNNTLRFWSFILVLLLNCIGYGICVFTNKVRIRRVVGV